MRRIDALRIVLALEFPRALRLTLDASYPKDPDPKHWKTINGSHVHLDANGNYDGGAGGKFNGRHHWGGSDWKQKGEKVSGLAGVLARIAAQKKAAAAKAKPVTSSELQGVVHQIAANRTSDVAGMDELQKLCERAGLSDADTQKALKAAKILKRGLITEDEARKKLETLLNIQTQNVASQTTTKNAGNGTMSTGNQTSSTSYQEVVDHMEAHGVKQKPVTDLSVPLTSEEIIKKLAGGDLTKGSCVSLALAYAGNRNGLDATDYRGGESQQQFACYWTLKRIANLPGATSETRLVAKEVRGAVDVLNGLEEGKEYIFAAGRHAAVVRKTTHGPEYLEMQYEEPSYNGWQSFNLYGSTANTFYERFKCRKTVGGEIVTMEIASLKGNTEFRDLLGYLNTEPGKQQKGVEGYAK